MLTAGVTAVVTGWELPNPFTYLAGAAGKVVADGWTAAMLGLWNAGLWVLRLVLTLIDDFLVPDVSEGGPASGVYRVTFWLAAALVILLALVQLGVAAFRRDGRSLATVVIGCGQFVMVWAAWVGYAVAVNAACGGLATALMQTLLNVDVWAAWQPWEPFDTTDITDGTVATVLGLLGLQLWVAAIGHLLIMLTRAGALLVLVATGPIAAAGLVSDLGKAWFWKSLRWFHAAAFSPVLVILILGLGIRVTSGVATGLTGTVQAAVGTALPGVVLIVIGCFAPVALFKLLSFVDPGTTSGAALRAGLAAQGGLHGLLTGADGQLGGAAGASATDGNGVSQAETSAQDATTARFAGSIGGVLGPVASAGIGAMHTLGSRGAAIGLDLANQMGVGHDSYFPDTDPSARSRHGNSGSSGGASGTPPHGTGTDGGGGGVPPDVAPVGDVPPAGPSPAIPTTGGAGSPASGMPSAAPGGGGALTGGGTPTAGAGGAAGTEIAGLGAAAL